MAMIATGSVAEISAANTKGRGDGPVHEIMSAAATTAMAATVPNTASVRIGARSRFSSLQRRASAASNSSGGRIR